MNSFHSCMLVVECHWKYLAPRIRVLLKSHIAEKEAICINGSWGVNERTILLSSTLLLASNGVEAADEKQILIGRLN